MSLKNEIKRTENLNSKFKTNMDNIDNTLLNTHGDKANTFNNIPTILNKTRNVYRRVATGNFTGANKSGLKSIRVTFNLTFIPKIVFVSILGYFEYDPSNGAILTISSDKVVNIKDNYGNSVSYSITNITKAGFTLNVKSNKDFEDFNNNQQIFWTVLG